MSPKCIMILLPVVLATVFATAADAFANPLHAQCTINWDFGISCQNVSVALQEQIKKWTSDDNCQQGGEKCLYKLVSVSDKELKATHETPAKHYVDDLTFTFCPKSSGPGCAVKGHSTSEVFYAILDYGTNYCNLENLITGSKLDKALGYNESTSDIVCTQYSSADCSKY